MMIKTLLTASAALALLAGGAHAEGAKKKEKPADAAATQMQDQMAQPAPMQEQTAPSATSPGMASDTSVNPSATDATSAGVNTAATVNTRIVTNGPVADTPENRAKFKPLSAAGRRTTPRGN
ncbi:MULTISPECIES: hypothetical protein [Phenylobacterium]|uniref:Proteophosphoglycan ppg4 n=1 Tax=Phenylobacterium koreense TaxID=266125 RepID=A0ABV2ED23_9CAUL